MKQIHSVVVTRAEGPIDLCGYPNIFDTLVQADDYLRGAAIHCGKGYDKFDFTISWEDCEYTYNGTILITHPDRWENNAPSIARHIQLMMEANQWQRHPLIEMIANREVELL